MFTYRPSCKSPYYQALAIQRRYRQYVESEPISCFCTMSTRISRCIHKSEFDLIFYVNRGACFSPLRTKKYRPSSWRIWVPKNKDAIIVLGNYLTHNIKCPHTGYLLGFFFVLPFKTVRTKLATSQQK